MNILANHLTYRVQTPGGEGKVLLHGVGVDLKPGTFTLIAGCTGSGKSTLLQLLAGLRAPSEGELYIGGAPLWSKGKRIGDVQRTVGFMHQYPEQQFFLPTLYDELAYSLKPLGLKAEERERRVSRVMESCGLEHKLTGRSPFQLSGGQKRRAALASVLVASPDWLILDEPSAGLDPNMASWLAQLLASWKSGPGRRGGIVAASHDLELFLPVADQVILLSHGQANGPWTTAQLVAEPQILEAAGLGIPASLKLARFAAAPSLDADAVALGLKRILEHAGSSEAGDALEESPRAEEPMALLLGKSEPGEQEGDRLRPFSRSGDSVNTSFGERLASLDPRAKWLIYLLFSIPVLAGSSGVVTAVGLALVWAVAYAGEVPLRKWSKPLLPLLSFMLLAFVIAGIQIPSPLSLPGFRFDWKTAFATLERLGMLLPVAAGGVLFNHFTTPLSMQRGLEVVLARIPGFSRAAQTIGLTVSLMFRFIRFIPGELARFSLLASSRGKQRGRAPGKLRLAQLPAFFIPLILAVMLHAEELSMAMEAKGYGRKGAQRTNAAPLQWRRKDGAACLAGIGAAVLLLAAGWLTR
ncbi:MAG: hypothetical protein K0R57_714 [Paenibacillaceae bacterium]|jgi:energy-coupling factor transport system ATP-binding protein|nr:hypothetical protein [Paenibacillaceae bacterium]